MDERTEWQKKMGVRERQVVYGRHAGTTKTVPEINNYTGKIGGAHHHHWDGSVSATIRPMHVQGKLHTRSGEME